MQNFIIKFYKVCLSFSLLVYSFTLVSCAKPNYQDSPDIQKQSQLKQTQNCSIRFQKQTDLCIQMQWTQLQNPDQMGRFNFYIYQINDPKTPLDIKQSITIKLSMPSMTHDSRPVIITKLADLHFDANKIWFSMSGLWQIHFLIDSNDEAKDEAIVEYTY